ncbi:SUMF1/EgtB/PvdO family nonheme iron enzyme [bacterium]|nr:SUMF1/EgtB/PvdO family nonheme iron enzyme [bacterium]
MGRIKLTLVCIAGLLLLATVNSEAINFDWAIIGDANNVDDIIPYRTPYGSVDHEYAISNEVTNAQYTEFLNAVATTDTYQLYNDEMQTNTMHGGIIQNGNTGNYTYTLRNNDAYWANKPVCYVSWYDALRFANWLNNGQPTGGQNTGTTEYGAYDMSLWQTNPTSIVRLSGATYWLPSEDEWYKAAYYDSSTQTYYDYATSSNVMPNNNAPDNDTGNSANYANNTYLSTDVGAYTDSESPYGTYDQCGNVWEFNEGLDNGSAVTRGASWLSNSGYLSKHYRKKVTTSSEFFDLGFRIAASPSAIPEPMSIGLLMISLGAIALRKTKKI